MDLDIEINMNNYVWVCFKIKFVYRWKRSFLLCVNVTGNIFVSDFGCFFASKSSNFKDGVRILGDKWSGHKLGWGEEESNAPDR